MPPKKARNITKRKLLKREAKKEIRKSYGPEKGDSANSVELPKGLEHADVELTRRRPARDKIRTKLAIKDDGAIVPSNVVGAMHLDERGRQWAPWRIVDSVAALSSAASEHHCGITSSLHKDTFKKWTLYCRRRRQHKCPFLLLVHRMEGNNGFKIYVGTERHDHTVDPVLDDSVPLSQQNASKSVDFVPEGCTLLRTVDSFDEVCKIAGNLRCSLKKKLPSKPRIFNLFCWQRYYPYKNNCPFRIVVRKMEKERKRSVKGDSCFQIFISNEGHNHQLTTKKTTLKIARGVPSEDGVRMDNEEWTLLRTVDSIEEVYSITTEHSCERDVELYRNRESFIKSISWCQKRKKIGCLFGLMIWRTESNRFQIYKTKEEHNHPFQKPGHVTHPIPLKDDVQMNSEEWNLLRLVDSITDVFSTIIEHRCRRNTALYCRRDSFIKSLSWCKDRRKIGCQFGLMIWRTESNRFQIYMSKVGHNHQILGKDNEKEKQQNKIEEQLEVQQQKQIETPTWEKQQNETSGQENIRPEEEWEPNEQNGENQWGPEGMENEEEGMENEEEGMENEEEGMENEEEGNGNGAKGMENEEEGMENEEEEIEPKSGKKAHKKLRKALERGDDALAQKWMGMTRPEDISQMVRALDGGELVQLLEMAQRGLESDSYSAYDWWPWVSAIFRGRGRERSKVLHLADRLSSLLLWIDAKRLPFHKLLRLQGAFATLAEDEDDAG